MNAIGMMTKVLSNGNRIVVANRGGNRIINVFSQNGASLWKTKVKNITRQNVGNKEVITRKELFYDGQQHCASNVGQVTTDRVYSSAGELLGMRKLSKINANTGLSDLRTIINNMKNSKDTYTNKQFLTPQGQIYKDIDINDKGLRSYATYLPNKYNIGHLVPANENGIVNQQIAGLDFLF